MQSEDGGSGGAAGGQGAGPRAGPRAGLRAGLRAELERRLRPESRAIPHLRTWRTGLRTLHIIAVSALYGGHVYGVSAERLAPAWIATLGTGGALMGLEIYRTSVWIVQVRGAATALKLALVAAVAAFWTQRVPLLTVAMVIGAVVSHMPGRWRYHSLLHGRVVGPRDKG